MQQMNERSRLFREAIVSFIDEQLGAKADGLNESEKSDEYLRCLENYAKRVGSIQMVTHPLKATYKDAHINKTTSLYRPVDTLQKRDEIGSHSLTEDVRDVSGNAADLGIFKFLKIVVEEKTLIDWFQDEDKDLIASLAEDQNLAKEWADAFKSLIRTSDQLCSHQMAKQIYWCVTNEPADDEGYHLLQPLFSSSFAHVVHQEIQDARFDDEGNKEARQARREGKPHDMPYRNYHGLAVRKLGGTKPHNISQLNSERRGMNYLLASLPPSWNQKRKKSLLSIDSAMKRFRSFEGVNDLINELLSLLKSDPDAVMETRLKRERIEKALARLLVDFSLEIRTLTQPGWSRDENCNLPLCEQVWLDSERAELPIRESDAETDQTFIDTYQWKDWPDEVAHRFGNWLNDILRKHGLPVGDAEHAHWAKNAIIEVEWSAILQRRAVTSEREVEHG